MAKRKPAAPPLSQSGGASSPPQRETWRVAAWLLAPVALGAGLVGYLVAGSGAPSTRTTAAPPTDSGAALASAPTSAPSGPAPQSAPPPPPASGSAPAADVGARIAHLKAIEAKPAKDRSIEENLDLVAGHVELGLADVAEIERALGPKYDVASASRLRAIARDDALAPAALAALARHPLLEHADLLYDVSTDPHASDAVRYLALDLLATDAMRKVASMALLLALDLPLVKDCETMKSFVARAGKSADDRSSASLRALEREDGCGRDKKGDCWACLRGSTLLYETRTAVSARPFTRSWR